jgi:hypothetical protein
MCDVGMLQIQEIGGRLIGLRAPIREPNQAKWIKLDQKKNGDVAEVLYFVGVPDGI